VLDDCGKKMKRRARIWETENRSRWGKWFGGEEGVVAAEGVLIVEKEVVVEIVVEEVRRGANRFNSQV
jgi:hypothetical protein